MIVPVLSIPSDCWISLSLLLKRCTSRILSISTHVPIFAQSCICEYPLKHIHQPDASAHIPKITATFIGTRLLSCLDCMHIWAYSARLPQYKGFQYNWNTVALFAQLLANAQFYCVGLESPGALFSADWMAAAGNNNTRFKKANIIGAFTAYWESEISVWLSCVSSDPSFFFCPAR